MNENRHQDPVAALRLFAGTTYSTAEATRLAGLTPRQVDWLIRHDVLGVKPNGSGRPHRFTDDDVARLRLAATLRGFGVSSTVIGRALAQLPARPRDWPAWLFISPDGEVRELAPSGPAWIGVQTHRLLDVEPEREAVAV